MLSKKDTFVVLVDLQEKLARVIHERQKVIDNTVRLLKGCRVLGVPVVWTEQNPAGLGKTVPEAADLLEGEPITKLSFSCWPELRFREAVKRLGRRHAVLAGIETHVCVYQTGADLAANGMEVQVVADAVSSRTEANREIGLSRMRDSGVSITSVETVLFELLGVAKGPAFKEILQIVK